MGLSVRLVANSQNVRLDLRLDECCQRYDDFQIAYQGFHDYDYDAHGAHCALYHALTYELFSLQKKLLQQLPRKLEEY